MRIRRIHCKIYRLQKNLDQIKYLLQHHLSAEQKALLEKIRNAEIMLQSGMKWDKIKIVAKISRSYYYQCKKVVELYGPHHLYRSKRPVKVKPKTVLNSIKELALQIRIENPTYGKEKIGAIIRRDYHILVSDSTVGRALSLLKQEGKIQLSRSANIPKKKRKFNKHAKRTKYIIQAAKPGDVLQVDHMSVRVNGVSCKHFAAWDRKSKYLFAETFSNATSLCASRFLKNIAKNTPFPIKSIQVDGGSEFMADFEKTCAELNINLFVLPPRRPQYNGGVERSNRICREEFYANKTICTADSVKGISNQLQQFLKKYNHYRPHKSLKLQKDLDPISPVQHISTYRDLIQSVII